jgi:hypothetical protein
MLYGDFSTGIRISGVFERFEMRQTNQPRLHCFSARLNKSRLLHLCNVARETSAADTLGKLELKL